MEKYKKYIISVLGIIIVLAMISLAVFMIYRMLNAKTPASGSNMNVISDGGKENEIEQDANKVIEESNTTDISETFESETNIVESQNTGTSEIYEQDNDEGSTDKKQEAINLVKQKWGEDDSVTFRCESINQNGEYVVAVISKKSAKVKNYFKVNLDKKEVTISY